MDNTPNLELPYLMAAQAQKHVTHNEAIRALDTLVQLAVLDRDLSAPPGSPADGDRYIVGASATEGWVGKDGQVAAWQDGAWAFSEPNEGWLAWVTDEEALLVWTGSTWSESLFSALQNLPMVGVNTTADTTNKLAVAADAVLFNHIGNGIQHKLNKNTAGDSASFLFQSNWSGRAEIGLTGDDNLHFKVSPDGSSWHEGLIIDKDSGYLTSQRLSSGQVTIADDSVAEIITPGSGGFVFISIVSYTGYPQPQHSGILAYDTGISVSIHTLALASHMSNLGTLTLSGTTGIDGETGVAVKAGKIVIENRGGASRVYSYTFIGGYID